MDSCYAGDIRHTCQIAIADAIEVFLQRRVCANRGDCSKRKLEEVEESVADQITHITLFESIGIEIQGKEKTFCEPG